MKHTINQTKVYQEDLYSLNAVKKIQEEENKKFAIKIVLLTNFFRKGM